MRISVKRSGGFAGISEPVADVDTATLSPAAQARVASLLNSSGFFAHPGLVPSTEVGADMLRYEITVEDDGKRHTVSFVDDDAPASAPFKQLLAAVSG